MANKHSESIELLAPTIFERHAQHEAAFFSPDEKTKRHRYQKSIEQFGKVKQVVYVEEDGIKKVIDGWAYVEYAKSNGITEVSAKRVEVQSEEDLSRLMLELQFSDHNTPAQEYRIYKYAYSIHKKGQGHRSDIQEKTDVNETQEDSWKVRRPNIFEKIAQMTNASSAKRVQYILKIGDTSPHYFERMLEERLSLHTAYTNCTAEERGEEPAPPTVKAPVYTSTNTGMVSFEKPTGIESKINTMHSEEDNVHIEAADIAPPGSDEHEVSIVPLPAIHPLTAKFEVICHHCKQKSVITILKKDTPWI